jgi:hypothetical protein
MFFYGRLHVIAYRGTLDVPRELALFVAKLLVAERRRRGTPRGSRALSCFWEAPPFGQTPSGAGPMRLLLRDDRAVLLGGLRDGLAAKLVSCRKPAGLGQPPKVLFTHVW